MANLPHVTVIGAGLMGHGIAYLFAAAGHEVSVQEPDGARREVLPQRIAEICDLFGKDHAVLKRVTAIADLREVVGDADVVIEAAPEKLALKQSIFAELVKHAKPTAILASNTSALPISRIAAGLATSERILGAHFWNPPHLVRLVEIVLMSEANRAAGGALFALMQSVGSHPVMVNRDIPGFIGNRLQHALKREAIALVASGVCDAQTVDDVVKHGFGARLGVLGPLEQSDLVGLDLTAAIHETLMPDLDVTTVVHPHLTAAIARGDLGMKTGKGFRSWTPEQADAVRKRLRDFLAEQAKKG